MLKSVVFHGAACVDHRVEFGSVEELCVCHQNLAECLVPSPIVTPNRRMAVLW